MIFVSIEDCTSYSIYIDKKSMTFNINKAPSVQKFASTDLATCIAHLSILATGRFNVASARARGQDHDTETRC